MPVCTSSLFLPPFCLSVALLFFFFASAYFLCLFEGGAPGGAALALASPSSPHGKDTQLPLHPTPGVLKVRVGVIGAREVETGRGWAVPVLFAASEVNGHR